MNANEERAIFAEIGDFSGVVSIRETDGTMTRRAFGHATLNGMAPNREDTRFGIASGTKPFTAVAILRLAEAGKLSLDAAVNGFIAPWSVDPRVTVRHLLTHTSGIADYFDEDIDDDYEALWRDFPNYRMEKPDDFLPRFAGKPGLFDPGSRFKYSDGGFVLLAKVVETVSGEGFPSFVGREVLAPAGMARSGFFRLDSLPDGTATGYIDDEGSPTPRSNVYSIPVIGGGDGGMYSTAADVDSFWDALLSYRLLGEAATERMMAPFAAAEDDDYGLGIWIKRDNPRIVFFDGSDPGVGFYSFHDRDSGKRFTVLNNRPGVKFRLFGPLMDWMASRS